MGGSGAAPLAFGGLLLGMGALVVSASEGLGVEAPPEHFLYQSKSECHFSNGTQRIRALDRYFFDRQELFYFDSDRGKYVAVAEMMESEVEEWNQDKDDLQSQIAEVDRFCRHNYEIDAPFAQARRVQPKVKITPTDNVESSPHNTLLICTVNRFFPAGIEIKWFRNGKEEPKVWTTDLIRNGDWTFHIEVMLETKPERGDVYTCQVEHASFEGPVTVKWEPQSDSARSKMWTGIVGIVLGLVFGATGLALYLKNKKGQAVPQPAGNFPLCSSILLLLPQPPSPGCLLCPRHGFLVEQRGGFLWTSPSPDAHTPISGPGRGSPGECPIWETVKQSSRPSGETRAGVWPLGDKALLPNAGHLFRVGVPLSPQRLHPLRLGPHATAGQVGVEKNVPISVLLSGL
uniref:H-2 class II histocompatibility antigen, E-S beta chain-like n=1 Tax=Podarcis muralis TaxID=64176 RepID=A0A670K1L4_PODMU